MTDWCSELDGEIVNCLVDQESLTPAALSREVGMSTEAVIGRIAIVRVARTSG